MPPVTKAGGTQFRKDVEFAETKDSDEYELEASGIVMVPDVADLQNDFAREDTIRAFTDQFGDFVDIGQGGGGIMHATWPDGWMELDRNEVLDEAEEIGGETVDPGAWVQRWGITNAQLAGLIDADILNGYSIGAIQSDWDGPYDPDEVDDVDTSEIPDGEVVYELTDGLIREVSAVDIPAVPDAQILEAKSLEKRLAEHVGNQDAFIEEAMDRGHNEDEAEQLWDVLNEAMEADGASEPGKQSVFAKAGKAFLSALSGTDDDGGSEDLDAVKEGRTLSKQNADDLKAVMDSAASVFRDAGKDPEFARFTDRDDDSFDLSEHTAREFDDPDEEEEEEDMFPLDPATNATEGDTSEPGSTDAADDTDTDMSDDNPDDGGDDTKSPAEENAEQINELTQSVEDLTDAVTGDGEKTVTINASAEGGDGDDAWEDAPEWAKSLKDNVKQNTDAIETISKQSGYSQQADPAAGDGGGPDPDDEVKQYKKSLVGGPAGGDDW
jgi:hypothetical protein